MKKQWCKKIYYISLLTASLWHLKHNLLPAFAPLTGSACCKLYPKQVQPTSPHNLPVKATEFALEWETTLIPPSSSVWQKLYPRQEWLITLGLFIHQPTIVGQKFHPRQGRLRIAVSDHPHTGLLMQQGEAAKERAPGKVSQEDQRLLPPTSVLLINQKFHSERSGPLFLPAVLGQQYRDFAQGWEAGNKNR